MKPFDIIVYAIVAFALILVLLNVWNSTNPPQTLADDIQKGLEKAQSSIFLGDTVIIDAKIFPKVESSYPGTTIGILFSAAARSQHSSALPSCFSFSID